MSILTEEQARAILDKVIKLSKADQCTAQLTGNIDGNIRFALNDISTGSLAAVNTAAADDPRLVTSDPYGEGWLFEIRPTAAGPLLTAAEYAERNEVSA